MRTRILIGAAVIAGVIGIGVYGALHRPPTAPAPASSSPAPAATVAPAGTVGLDLMRIEPVGSFIAAGHAVPGSVIQIHDNDGGILADGLVDGRGEWLLSSHNPLSAGSHELFLYWGTADAAPLQTDITAVVNVPAVRGPRPLAIEITAGAAPRLLQSPDGPAASAGLIESAEFSEKDVLTLGGRADPGTLVYIYVDDAFLGEASADAEGRWIRPGGGDSISPGVHRVRIDVLSAGGEVAARGTVNLGQTAEKFTGLAVSEEPKLWRVRRASEPGAVQEVVVFRPGAVERADPKAILPGQMISPQTMPLQPTPLEPVENGTADR